MGITIDFGIRWQKTRDEEISLIYIIYLPDTK